MSDGLFSYILRQLEAAPKAMFRESGLCRISRQEFNTLVTDGYLVFDHCDKERDPYFSDREGDRDRERFLKKRGDRFFAHSVDPGIASIEVSKEETTYHRFNHDLLAQKIKDANKLAGTIDQNFSQRLIYLGKDGISNTAFLLGYFEHEKQVEDEALVIWSKIAQHNNAVVICPTRSDLPQALRNKLQSKDIHFTAFNVVMKRDFTFDIKKAGIKLKKTATVRETKAEEAARKKYGYKTSCKLTFLDRQDNRGRYVVQIDDGNEFGIDNANFIFLVYLSIRLKKDKNGWINKELTEQDELTDKLNEFHIQTKVSELRKELKGKVENAEKFIETKKGKGEYRLSMNPANIKTSGTHWLKQKFKLILPIVQKERARRVKIAKE